MASTTKNNPKIIGDALAEATLRFTQNANYRIAINITSDDSPVDISGESYYLGLYDDPKRPSETKKIKATVIDAATGKIRFDVTKTIVNGLTIKSKSNANAEGYYSYGRFIMWKDDGTNEVPIASGPVYVKLNAIDFSE